MSLKKFTVAFIFGFGIFTVSQGVSAEVAADYNSEVNIQFIENDEVTKPVDPNDPDKEVDIDDETVGGGTAGPLSIDYASNIDFGDVKKSGNEITYFANPITINGGEERAPYVQVTDNRGTKTGWNLQVKQNEQFTNDEGDSVLEGAQLSLRNGAVNSQSSTENVNSTDIEFNNFNELYPVLNAADGSGAGTFTNQFGTVVEGKATDVALVIPADIVIEDGKYSTELTWVLEDTP